MDESTNAKTVSVRSQLFSLLITEPGIQRFTASSTLRKTLSIFAWSVLWSETYLMLYVVPCVSPMCTCSIRFEPPPQPVQTIPNNKAVPRMETAC